MKRRSRFVAAAVLGLGLAGCKDPEGACEFASTSPPSCSQGPKSYCEEGRTFHQGKTCAALGYPRKEGITWFKPLPGL